MGRLSQITVSGAGLTALTGSSIDEILLIHIEMQTIMIRGCTRHSKKFSSFEYETKAWLALKKSRCCSAG
jgi:hypothetical protein